MSQKESCTGTISAEYTSSPADTAVIPAGPSHLTLPPLPSPPPPAAICAPRCASRGRAAPALPPHDPAPPACARPHSLRSRPDLAGRPPVSRTAELGAGQGRTYVEARRGMDDPRSAPPDGVVGARDHLRRLADAEPVLGPVEPARGRQERPFLEERPHVAEDHAGLEPGKQRRAGPAPTGALRSAGRGCGL